MAPTLDYNHAAIFGKDGSVPARRAARLRVPALVMSGEPSYPFMGGLARTLIRQMPHA
jgi:hypothetical protein